MMYEKILKHNKYPGIGLSGTPLACFEHYLLCRCRVVGSRKCRERQSKAARGTLYRHNITTIAPRGY